MCGRYAASRHIDQLAEEFEIRHVDVRETLEPDYNVAPTKPVPAVLTRSPRGRRDDPPVRQLVALRWGLVPSWAKEAAIGNKLINARMETVADKPAFRKAFARRRCLLPADGYYEWYATEQKTARGRPVKQPYFIHPRDGSQLAMAGLYEVWRDKARQDDDPEALRWTCAVITTSAPDDLGRIHDRMPLLVEPDRWNDWLDPAPRTTAELLGLLVPAAPGRLEAYPVTTEVNKVDNNGPQLLNPLPLEQETAQAMLTEGAG